MRAVVLALLLASGPALAAPDDAACRRDLLVADSGQRVAQDNLERAGDSEAERCAAWRSHVGAMRRISATLSRCLPGGPDRTARMARTESQAREFEGLVRDRCKGR